MAVSQKLFRRKFSLTMYKNKRLMLAEMSFFKDFVHDTRGDMYPVLEKAGEYSECVAGGKYEFSGGENAHAARLIGAHFPYASYEIKIDSICISLIISLYIILRDEYLYYQSSSRKKIKSVISQFTFSARTLLLCINIIFIVYLNLSLLYLTVKGYLFLVSLKIFYNLYC